MELICRQDEDGGRADVIGRTETVDGVIFTIRFWPDLASVEEPHGYRMLIEQRRRLQTSPFFRA